MINYQQVLTSNTLIHTGAGLLAGLVVSAAAETANPSLSCYDGTDASGTLIFRLILGDSPYVQPFRVFFPDRFAPRFETGLYVVVSSCTVNLWASGTTQTVPTST